MVEVKECTKCKIEKPLSRFGKRKSRKGKPTSWCRDCYAAYTKVHRKKPEARKKYKANKHAYYHRGKGKIKVYENFIKRKYGITLDHLNAILSKQKSKCAVCKRSLTNIKKCVDHCHVTGVVRGILCNCCNLAEGLLRTAKVCESLLEYMKSRNMDLWISENAQ